MLTELMLLLSQTHPYYSELWLAMLFTFMQLMVGHVYLQSIIYIKINGGIQG